MVVPKSDIFVVMLGIALGAIVLGCILMFWVFGSHGFSITVSSLQGMTLPASSGFSSPGNPSIG